jgi:serine/threonine protein kinase
MDKYTYDPYYILGKGGFANVYKGFRKHDNLPIAVKIIWLINDNVHNEIEIQQLCAHSNIVEIYDWVIEDDLLYIIMEQLDEDLWTKFTNEKITNKKIKSILYDIILAINHCHSKGVIHNDIKLENIVVDNKTGKAKLCDFGSASFIDNPPITGGTNEFLSPEIIKDRQFNIKSDAWAFGILLFELITGYYPFGDNAYVDNILNKEPDYSLIKKPVIRDLIKKLLEKDINKRITLQEAINHPFFKNTKGKT